jgi:A nuclease family of the HNH/ENDO VII superfamily with conserved AHH
VGRLSRVGPLLVALGLLWPSSTVGPEEDSRPPWADAQREFEARLRDVSEASRQLLEELEAQSSPGEAMAAEPGSELEPAQGKGSPPAARTTGDCRPESNKGDANKHHIATDKNSTSDASGGPWTPLFEDLFKRAGMDLQDPSNIVYLLKHRGPHPRDYHEEVYRRLRDALAGCRTTSECRKRLVDELDRIAADICKSGSALNKLLTR